MQFDNSLNTSVSAFALNFNIVYKLAYATPVELKIMFKEYIHVETFLRDLIWLDLAINFRQ